MTPRRVSSHPRERFPTSPRFSISRSPTRHEIAKLTATADAAVPAGMKGADLADFYYKRAQARALLGRS